jgi:hypothetical protein
MTLASKTFSPMATFEELFNQIHQPTTPAEQREKVLKKLAEIETTKPEFVSQGPSYQLMTKSGERMFCTSTFIDVDGVESESKKRTRKINEGPRKAHLVLRNEKEEVVGHYGLYLEPSQEGKVRATSEIEILEKGKGLSTILGQACVSFLQYIADKRKESIKWKITNQNKYNRR